MGIKKYRFPNGYTINATGSGEIVMYADHIASHNFDETDEIELCRADWLADCSEDRPAYADYLKGWLACAKSRASKCQKS